MDRQRRHRTMIKYYSRLMHPVKIKRSPLQEWNFRLLRLDLEPVPPRPVTVGYTAIRQAPVCLSAPYPYGRVSSLLAAVPARLALRSFRPAPLFSYLCLYCINPAVPLYKRRPCPSMYLSATHENDDLPLSAANQRRVGGYTSGQVRDISAGLRDRSAVTRREVGLGHTFCS